MAKGLRAVTAIPTLRWSIDGDGLRLYCQLEDEELPFDEWGRREDLRTSDGARVRLAPALALAEADRAEVRPDGSLWLPSETVASLQPADLAGLGLPAAAPFTIRIDKTGILTDKNFSIRASLVKSGGQQVVGPQVDGSIVKIGSRSYTLSDPLFSVLRAVDRLNEASDFESRGPHLEALQRSLPPDALADDYLKFVHIGRADSFTVLPRVNQAGEVDFDVRPSRAGDKDSDVPSSGLSYRAVLPEAREAEWNRQFRSSATVRRTYAAGSGHYITLSDALRDALGTIGKVQQSPSHVRAAFVRNPRAFIRENIGEFLPEEALESLFWESGEYSSRVREVGLWQPKVLPFVRKRRQSWLPPEEIGLRVGDQMVRIDPKDADRLLGELTAARNQEIPSIDYQGNRIPATDEAIASVKELVQAVAPAAPPSAPGERPAQSQPRARIAVLIADNLQSTEFQRELYGRQGVVGDSSSRVVSQLYPFQMEGVRWLQNLWVAGAAGGLLADDMGLGKTVQTLAFLAWLRDLQEQGVVERKPILIVGPTGLLRNWKAEHDVHLRDGGIGSLFEAHGLRLRQLRQSLRTSELDIGIPVLDVGSLGQQDCVLTTYETLRDYQHSFAKVRWGIVILDEAQKVRNPGALMTESVKALNSEFTVALTGTPVENHLADLWCITDAVQPGCLGALKPFVDYYQPEGSSNPERLDSLKALLTERQPPTMLRRMKHSQLRGLPSITVHVVRSEMPPSQAAAYDAVISAARAGAAKKGSMLQALHHMRAVSLHPLNDFDGNHGEFIAASARLVECFKALDVIASAGEKALIFLEALSLQGVVAELIQRRYGLSAPPLIINGSVEGSRRKARVDTFQSRDGFDTMVLSPRAAGVGLTITEANHVIHLSRWWNPAVEDQATDRVYRIGQLRPVHVYTPLAVHPRLGDSSFDVRLHQLVQAKRELSRNVLTPPTMSESELTDLYRGTVQ
jgi:hypothetical protein